MRPYVDLSFSDVESRAEEINAAHDWLAMTHIIRELMLARACRMPIVDADSSFASSEGSERPEEDFSYAGSESPPLSLS